MQVAQKPRRAVWAGRRCAPVIVFVIAAAAVFARAYGRAVSRRVYAASQTAGQRVDADFASEIVNLQAFGRLRLLYRKPKILCFPSGWQHGVRGGAAGLFHRPRHCGGAVRGGKRTASCGWTGRTDYERYLKDNDGLRVVERPSGKYARRVRDQRLLQSKRHALLRLHAVQPLCGAIRAADFANYVLKRGQNGIFAVLYGQKIKEVTI